MSVVHIEMTPPFTMCGTDGDRIGIRFVVGDFPKAARLMRLRGCPDCLKALEVVYSTERLH